MRAGPAPHPPVDRTRPAISPATDPPATQSADPAAKHADFAAAVRAGLSKPYREIPARFLYDQQGSELFVAITDLPEYYPTRTEIGLIEAHSAAIGAKVGKGRTVVEFGSGSSAKTPPFLRAVEAKHYVPIDISADFLADAAETVRQAVPDLQVHPLPGDFTNALSLPDAVRGEPLMGFFPGSTIGNMSAAESVDLLRAFRATLGQDAPLVIGIDLKKDVGVLEPAYDDGAGVTARFILGILRRLRADLGADLDESAWAYDSFWNADMGRIEMHVRAEEPTSITLGEDRYTFTRSERIHISNSHKYSVEESALLARAAGYHQTEAWRDSDALFSLQLWHPLADDLNW
ncbi:MAG: L-histidine N(alpha)-methyltransferase [Pacificimonas sp.]|jgi:dimethylhistidine N-methyltransferase|nr:L-histidine N(alpha)-methyltransferase [Pacificimonas sp.]